MKFQSRYFSRGGGELRWGVKPASQNPYPSYEQNLRFSLPYLSLDQPFVTLFMAKIDTLFMTKADEKPYPLGPHIPI